MAQQAQDFNVFPGFDGIPFRTRKDKAPSYKEQDEEKNKPAMVIDMHVDNLDMAKDDDRKRLAGILTMCASGKAYQSQRVEEFDHNTGSFKVLMIWGSMYLEDPQEIKEHESKQYS